MSSGGCDVCGDRVNNSRYGAPACLGCTVFFRRSIVKHMKYFCLKNKDCVIHFSYRVACRYCRFQKCLKVGLRENAIQRRDVLGPRKSTKEKLSKSPEVIVIDDQPDSFLLSWTNFQKNQFSEHLRFFAENKVDVAFHKDQSVSFIYPIEKKNPMVMKVPSTAFIVFFPNYILRVCESKFNVPKKSS
ncbi:hypothetical protein CAEBREN_09493 [Caenorhabditis brenneri]|uniref:Nuclear receptor domain-containing protein n=1 Tax=Caenorhabditis brenneri TaxID=135651 RepID=G0NMS1_CAEBE|nr:hypothetical protein CAEBREN_09493 [Caenorhabditis brenneri]